ncbi:uncharacterized protein LOC124452271 [Xenia sp. Carnegie-2017]|uniref:uncharacterized protein LOC124452271 n=1 Tax=Xenia sp. Carnegie-2017 TaxID=2897299 RepID=UPI001F045112|nr:uncharacterized protein LOC124452271 [Xenia sp. Carnegie-2017]
MNWSKIFVPSACGTCSCGAAWDKRDVSDDWLDVEGCHVAYLYDFHCVNVYYRLCSTCTNKKRYDGIENNVLWFGSFSISHAVLKDYIRHFLVSSLPMYKYYVTYVQRQVISVNLNFSGIITYTKFRLAVTAMIRLLDIDFVDAFHCNICGKHPKKVVMDGTALGIQKTFLPRKVAPQKALRWMEDKFETRNFLNRKRQRVVEEIYKEPNYRRRTRGINLGSICYGFQVMPDHESPNVPFTILRTRFSEAPELVIYDNACKLHEYCLNRDPAFFKKSKFIVDKFHWRNHSGCSEGYDINRYPILKTHNSQAAEQCNSVMKPLASMVSYMEYDNFLLFSKLYIWYRNMLRIIKCNPGRDVPEGNVSCNQQYYQISSI